MLPRLSVLCILLCAPSAGAQQFVRNTTDIPPSAEATENVDFADVDLDGDWDAVFANGGDVGNEQDRIWINAFGGSPVGHFTERTPQQFPAVLDDGRDIEFVDYDADGDPDIYVSNTSQRTNQPNRWFHNMGSQAGTIGFYQEQTAARWSGLGGPGSSIAPTLLIGGGFVDFSCDCDFGDLDNDGDLDLVHSTYGGAFTGQSPTRIFLNDGTGVFAEFNPSGYQLPSLDIGNGNPGLWCQGTQSADTLNSNGTFCDIASTPLDIDVGDVDGDLDLDILHGARIEQPRLFQNRLAEQGALAFRDVTGAAFVPGYAVGSGHYEQEMGDQDGDGDLDIYGLNWINFEDAVYKNNGNGTFGFPTLLSGSGSDDNEADYFDFDGDGDLDVFVARFAGPERVYQNDGLGNYTPAVGLLELDGTTSLDADACDVDGDGDPDVFVANDNSQSEWYLENQGPGSDVTPPVFPVLEQAPNRAAGATPTIVRASVHDNAPYYITWYDTARLDVTVDGGAVASYPMRSMQGDLFRGEIPGHLVGAVCYRVVALDEYGNTGTSVTKCYTATPGSTGMVFCAGDGTGTACPCGNAGSPGQGCANSLFAVGARLSASGTASLAGDSLVLTGTSMPNSSALYFQGTNGVNGGLGAAFGDGLRCAGGAIRRLGTKSNAGNQSSYPTGADLPISVRGAVPGPGSVRTYQVWYRNSAAFCQPETFNLSNGLEITWGA